MNKVIMMDTREQAGKHEHVIKWFNDNEYKIVRSKLFCGDYTFLNNQTICIDTKKDILEICQNVCQSHERFIREIQRANENGIKLYFLIQDEKITKLEELPKWYNPRKRFSPKATSGKQLYGILKTIQERYNTKFYFCTNEECGKKIIEYWKVRQMQEKKGMVMYESFYDSIKMLPTIEEQNELLNKICEYGFYGKETESKNQYINIIFGQIKYSIDMAAKRYEASVENGQNGGRPKKMYR